MTARTACRLRTAYVTGFWLAAFCAQAASADANSLHPATPAPFVTLHLYADAGPVSINAALDDWLGPLGRGRHQETDDTVSVGVAMPGTHLAVFQRYVQALDFNDDTAALYHQQRNGGALVPGDTYALSLDAMRFSALGLSWRQRLWHSPRGAVAATLAGFRASDLLDGRVRGSATVIDADSFAYNAQVDYRYDEDALFDRVVAAPRGVGASLGIDAQVLLAPRVTMALTLNDVAGQIRWHHVPATTASATSSRTWVDAAGNPVVGPAVSGREYFLHGWTQQIPLTGKLTLAAQLDARNALGARVEQHLTGSRLAVAFSRRFAGMLVSAEVYPQDAGIGIGVTLPMFALRAAGDAITHDNAHWQRLDLDVGDAPASRANNLELPAD